MAMPTAERRGWHSRWRLESAPCRGFRGATTKSVLFSVACGEMCPYAKVALFRASVAGGSSNIRNLLDTERLASLNLLRLTRLVIGLRSSPPRVIHTAHAYCGGESTPEQPVGQCVPRPKCFLESSVNRAFEPAFRVNLSRERYNTRVLISSPGSAWLPACSQNLARFFLTRHRTAERKWVSLRSDRLLDVISRGWEGELCGNPGTK